MLLVNGKQRLTAAMAFMQNQLPVFDGHYFRDFSVSLVHRLFTLIFYVSHLPTHKDVLCWYLDLSSGGIVHSQNEINRDQNLLKCEA